METEHARQRVEQQSEIEKLKGAYWCVETDLQNAQQNLLTIRSPYDGVIISMDERTAGSVVSATGRSFARSLQRMQSPALG